MATAPSTTVQMGSSPIVTTTVAMASIFIQPPDCASSWTFEPFKYNNWYPGILMQNCGSVVSSCFPSGFANSGRLSASVIYSPGYCPAGYTSVDATVHGGTTTATCCYSDFSYTTSAQIDSHSVTASFAGCTSMFALSSSTTVPKATPHETGSQGSTQITEPVLMWAQPITILHQASDSASEPANTTSESTTISKTVSHSTSKTSLPVSQSTTATSEPDSATKYGPSTVSMAAVVGIGIGAGVVAFFVAAMAFWWFWRRRRNKLDMPGITETPSRKQQYLCNISTGGTKQPYELRSDSRYVYPLEVDNTQARASKYLAEMPG